MIRTAGVCDGFEIEPSDCYAITPIYQNIGLFFDSNKKAMKHSDSDLLQTPDAQHTEMKKNQRRRDLGCEMPHLAAVVYVVRSFHLVCRCYGRKSISCYS